MNSRGDEAKFDWRGGWAAAIAFIATVVLLGMVVLVALSNDAREKALADERHAYDVALVTRSVSSSASRAEAALGRFVLDEEIKFSGNIYYSQWRLAGHQIEQLKRLVRNNPQQLQRVTELVALFEKRGEELALPARAAATKTRQGGTA